ncbi:MAG: AbrB/MazE/SpoVT family DNA-binding domain-containing protein [Longimicrobiales bacterium]
MPAATVTSKGQITIPKQIRDALGLAVGDKVDFVVESDGRVVLRPATRSILDLAGLLHREGGRVVSVEQMNEAVRKRGSAR